MEINKTDILAMDTRYRAALINSLAGARQAVLIGTKDASGQTNLAIFNSIIHLGANPALYGFICRPDTVERHTLANIKSTKRYTFNFVSDAYAAKAHQTSARYNANESEFDKVGFTPLYQPHFHAPYVQEAVVQIGLQLQEILPIHLNGTIMVIGSLENIYLPDTLVGSDGFVSLHAQNILACAGLDAYYTTQLINRFAYAKPEKVPTILI